MAAQLNLIILTVRDQAGTFCVQRRRAFWEFSFQCCRHGLLLEIFPEQFRLVWSLVRASDLSEWGEKLED